MIGELLGPYRLTRKLGAGGMGTVWEAEHTETGVRYAIKRFLCDDGELRERLEREAEALGRLNHPHVVRIHQAHFGASPYLVQELLEGGSLQDRLRAGPLAVSEAVDAVTRLAGAVGAAHGVGVLHRDIKPDNVVYDERGEPRLVDFGLARLVGAASLTETGSVMGSPGYLAPEVAAGETADERADVYGLSALLFALLTGRPPFLTGGGMLAHLQAVAYDAPPSPSSLNSQVPAWLDRVCAEGLEKSPHDRFSSPAALAAALVEGPARRRGRRTSASVAVVVSVAALSVAALAFSVRQPSQSAASASSTPAPSPDPSRARQLQNGEIQRLLEGDLPREALEILANRQDAPAQRWRAEARALAGEKTPPLDEQMSDILAEHGRLRELLRSARISTIDLDLKMRSVALDRELGILASSVPPRPKRAAHKACARRVQRLVAYHQISLTKALSAELGQGHKRLVADARALGASPELELARLILLARNKRESEPIGEVPKGVSGMWANLADCLRFARRFRAQRRALLEEARRERLTELPSPKPPFLASELWTYFEGHRTRYQVLRQVLFTELRLQGATPRTLRHFERALIQARLVSRYWLDGLSRVPQFPAETEIAVLLLLAGRISEAKAKLESIDGRAGDSVELSLALSELALAEHQALPVFHQDVLSEFPASSSTSQHRAKVSPDHLMQALTQLAVADPSRRAEALERAAELERKHKIKWARIPWRFPEITKLELEGKGYRKALKAALEK